MSPNSAADPSGREPLNESAEHEQGWSKCTDLAVDRKLSDCGGSHSDADESDRKHATASDAVAKYPEKQSPERPHNECHPEGCERREQCDARVSAWKKSWERMTALRP